MRVCVCVDWKGGKVLLLYAHPWPQAGNWEGGIRVNGFVSGGAVPEHMVNGGRG